MKCPICDGMGTSNTCVNGTFKPCSFCDGTGEVKDNLCKTCGTICPFDDEHEECEEYSPRTNEQWFCWLPTSEKAKVLNDIFWKYFNYVDEHELVDDDVSEIYLRWLKEKHDEMQTL